MFRVIFLWIAVVFVTVQAGLASAQSAVPDSRFVITRDVDFYGSDLDALFDTDLASCQRQCAANAACVAFTFNSRSNACFPKSEISDRTGYQGAISAAKVSTDPGVMSRAQTRAGDLSFLGTGTLAAARNEAWDLALRHPAGTFQLDEVLQAIQSMAGIGNNLQAMRFTGIAVSLTDRADLWTEYARLSLTLDGNPSDTRRNANQAVLASANGYLRADGPGGQVNALLEMSKALEKVGRGRDMISALRLAQSLQDRPATTEALEAAIAKYGFRVSETQVDNDAAAPRICVEFSEPLIRAGQDYAPFVGLDDSRLAVVAEGNALCIDGVEHGLRYRFTLRKGLPAASGEALWKDVEITQYVRDRSPSVRFPGRSYVLPKVSGANVPVQTVNLDRLDLVLRRVSDRNLVRAQQQGFFGRPLSYWETEQFETELAEEVWTGTADVETELNREMTTRLPMAEAIASQPPGIYALTASVPGADPYESPGATQWFVLTDLGLSSMQAQDGLYVTVRGLSDATPRAGVSVELVSRANAVLAAAETDATGTARFDAGLARGSGAKAPALILARAGAGDMSFLSLTDPAFDLSDRGVDGRAAPGPVDVFLTTDRGAYRAGEAINATVLTRDDQVRALSDLPITAILKRPDGVEYARRVSVNGPAGGHVFNLPLGETVPRGTWTLAIHLDPGTPALAETRLLVEDFLPERIDFDLSVAGERLRQGEVPPLTVSARYLFGAPGADLEVEGHVDLGPASDVPGWAGYRFGRYDTRLDPVREFFGGARTDAQGVARVPVEIPRLSEADRPLQARFTVRVADGAARPVERQLTVPVTPNGPVIGIRPRFDGAVAENSEAGFDVIALDADLSPMSMQVQWTLNRVETRYQWYQLWGNWNWEPVERRTRIATGEATLGALAADLTIPVEWGEYELVVERQGGAYVAGAVRFDAGWYAPADASSTPDRLDMSLNRDSFDSGETAMLRVNARYAGTALISVLSDRVISRQFVELPAGETTIPVQVTDDWGTGAYVSATLLRPMDVDAGQAPARALGLAYARVAPGTKALSVRIDAPAQAPPRGAVPVRLAVDGVAPGEQAYVTLAAVDLGILNLTGFQSPDPQGFYFGQKRLGVELRDVYGRLIDGMTGALGDVRSGGDGQSGLSRKSPPPTQDLLAIFSGLVTVDGDGFAEVTLDLPAFNGTVRLMAVAWSETGVGQSEMDMLVRDPVVATLSGPRFLAPGDQSRLLLELIHADGPTGRVGLGIDAPGLTLASVPEKVDLGDGETLRLALDVTADAVGDYPITLRLTTPDGRELRQDQILPVRSNDPVIAQTRRFQLAAGDAFAFSDDVFADMRPGTGTALLTAGPLARFDVPGLLSRLEQYPYGCTEQVTSRAMPLLYLSSVSSAIGLGDAPQVSARIDDAIARVLTRQAANGAFGLWRPETGEFWLDAYVTDFLSRARAEGHTVPDLAFTLALDNLRNRVNYAPDFDRGGADIAYALLVLAREGKAAMADLRYYADVKAGNFSTALAVAQLGAALAAYGDQLRADALFARAAGMLTRPEPASETWRADFGTNLRDTAGVLRLAAVSGSAAIDRAPLVQRVTAPVGRTSTQEAAWMLLAAQALIDTPESSGLLVDGAASTGPFVRLRESGTGGETVLTAADGSTVDITLTTLGVPLVPPPAGGSGYAITRRYYALDGQELGPEPWGVGDRFVTVLRISPAERIGARLIIDDPLPAGVEIDNPSLLRSGDIAALEWLQPSLADHTEFRSDRFLAAVNSRGEQDIVLAYVARAVSPGAFHHPAATVEDMYRPDRRARTSTGRVTITP